VIEPFAPKPTWREEFGTSDFSPGPRWRDVVDEVPGAPFETLWHNGVDIRSTVDDRSALSNTDGDDLAGEWVDTQEEPSVQCQRVGGLLPLATGGATLPRFSSAHPAWSSTTGTR
jgi:hypothetical protein